MCDNVKTEFGLCKAISVTASTQAAGVKEEPHSTDLTNTKIAVNNGICGCCLACGDFEAMNSKTEHTDTYFQMLRYTFNLTLSSNDIKLICQICSNLLRQAYHFKNRILHSEKVLSERSIEIHVKNENIDVNNCLDTDLKISQCIVKTDVEVKMESESDCETLSSIKKKKALKRTVKKLDCSEIQQPCDVCNARIHSKTHRQKHMLTKHLTCKRCKKIFKTPTETLEHKKNHSVQCSICDAIFDDPKSRSSHMLTKHGPKCKVCGVPVLPKNKAKHNIDFHGAEPYKCGICDKSFRVKFKLTSHQRQVHMKERNAPCPHCDFVSFDANSLRKHMLTHSVEKKHQCDYCNKRFVRRDTLNFHLRIHTGDKRKICKYCGEAFVQRASLKYHLEKYHPGDFY